MRQWFLGILMFLLLTLGLFEQPLGAYPYDLHWRTMETEHFRISYHQGLENMARQLARMAEHIYSEMTPLLEYEPKFKTEIALVDHVDTPNGWVNVYPYNHMVLYAVPPGRKSVLNDYDDWYRVLFSHEFTHVIQLDTKSGIPAAVNMIFGGMIHPNQYMPRWYTEGMAIFHESFFTAGGRQRSALFDMYLRMDSLQDHFLEIDQIGANTDRWPRGNIWYLYGARFMQYLADKYDQKTFAALGYLYGQRLIPYSLNTVLKRITDDDYLRLYAEWKDLTIARYRRDSERLKALGLTELHPLTDTGEDHDSARFFPTGDKMLYFHDDARPNRHGWAVLDLDTMEHEIVIEADDDGGATIAPDGRRVVTGQLTYTRMEYYYYDLFLHDLERKTSERLTDGLRARDPSFAPDGRHLAFVSFGPGQSKLMLLDVDSKDAIDLLPEGNFDQVFSPAWSPDGRYLAFTGWRQDGFKDIYLYDFDTQQIIPITQDNALDMSPTWSFDGRQLFWSSDRTGIYNAYSYDTVSKQTRQLTNVLGGVFSPLATPDGKRLIVSSYKWNGYDLAWIDLEKLGAPPAPDVPELRPRRTYDEPEVPFEDREYSPFPSLYPKLWKPTSGEDHAGSTLGIHMWGDDIAGNHHWELEADVGLKSGDPTIGVSYSYKRFLPNLSLRATHTSYTVQAAAIKNGEVIDQNESRTGASASISFPFTNRLVRGLNSHHYGHTLSLSTNFRYTRLLNRYDYEPLEDPPTFADTGLGSGFSIGWSYNNRQGFPGFVGSASGRSLYVNVRTETEVLGSQFNNITVVGGWAEYIANPWVDGHSLAMKISGGMGLSDYQDRRLFYIGGLPESDFVSDLIRNNRVYGDFIRGYDPYSIAGDKFFLFKSEYRFVIWNIDRGVATLPIYFRRLHAAPFFDAGYPWAEDFEISDTRKGIGGEIRLDILVGYFQAITLRMGYQAGLDQDGIRSLYFSLDNVF